MQYIGALILTSFVPQVAVWMDSDTLAVGSLHTLFDLSSSLSEPGSAEPGPRIGGAFAREHFTRLQRHGDRTTVKINTGVFIVKPGIIRYNLDIF